MFSGGHFLWAELYGDRTSTTDVYNNLDCQSPLAVAIGQPSCVATVTLSVCFIHLSTNSARFIPGSLLEHFELLPELLVQPYTTFCGIFAI